MVPKLSLISGQVRLNLYERGIVEILVAQYGFNTPAARQLVDDYIKVIRRLGGYGFCLDHATRLV